MSKEKKMTANNLAVIEAKFSHIVESVVKEESAVATPEGFEGGREISSFAPVASLENIGEYVAGYFKGMKENVGPNASRLYLIELPKTKEIVAVWGCTVLDSKIMASGVRHDDKILIQRIEDIPAKKKGQSAAKNFRLLLGS